MKNNFYGSEQALQKILIRINIAFSDALKSLVWLITKPIVLLVFISFIFINSGCHKSQSQMPADLWQKLNTSYFGNPLDIKFISADTGYILAMNSEVPIYNTLIKTNDGGKSWQEIDYTDHKFLTDTSDGLMSSIYVSPFNSNIIFSGRNNLIRSTDGGMNWQIINPMSQTSFPIWFFDPLNGIGMSVWGISTTTNGGQTWIKSSPDISPQRIQFSDREIGYGSSGYIFTGVAGGFFSTGRIIKTTNGGKDWNLLNYPGYSKDNKEGPGVFGLNFINNDTGFIYVIDGKSGNAYSDSKIYKTTDGGNSWIVVNSDLIGKYGYLNNFYMENEMEGFLTSDKGIFNTHDGGKTWQKESDLKIEFFCAADKNTLYAIDFAGNVYKRVS